jgi:hypothetical protein
MPPSLEQAMAEEKPDPMMTTMVVKPGWRPPGTTYKTLKEFYPYYLGEHSNRTCRRLHFIGTTMAIGLMATAVILQMWWLIAVAFVQGYAWAWVGHFFFEHNKPATFKYPWLSFRGDWKMWWQMLTGKIAF